MKFSHINSTKNPPRVVYLINVHNRIEYGQKLRGPEFISQLIRRTFFYDMWYNYEIFF